MLVLVDAALFGDFPANLSRLNDSTRTTVQVRYSTVRPGFGQCSLGPQLGGVGARSVYYVKGRALFVWIGCNLKGSASRSNTLSALIYEASSNYFSLSDFWISNKWNIELQHEIDFGNSTTVVCQSEYANRISHCRASFTIHTSPEYFNTGGRIFNLISQEKREVLYGISYRSKRSLL